MHNSRRFGSEDRDVGSGRETSRHEEGDTEWSSRDETWRGSSQSSSEEKNDCWRTTSPPPPGTFQFGRDRAPDNVDEQFLIRIGAKRLNNGNLVDRNGFTLRQRDPDCQAPSPPSFNPGREERAGTSAKLDKMSAEEIDQKARQQIEMMEKLAKQEKRKHEPAPSPKKAPHEENDEWGEDEYDDAPIPPPKIPKTVEEPVRKPRSPEPEKSESKRERDRSKRREREKDDDRSKRRREDSKSERNDRDNRQRRVRDTEQQSWLDGYNKDVEMRKKWSKDFASKPGTSTTPSMSCFFPAPPTLAESARFPPVAPAPSISSYGTWEGPLTSSTPAAPPPSSTTSSGSRGIGFYHYDPPPKEFAKTNPFGIVAGAKEYKMPCSDDFDDDVASKELKELLAKYKRA